MSILADNVIRAVWKRDLDNLKENARVEIEEIENDR